MGLKGGYLADEGDLIWVGYRPICSSLGTLEVWTGAVASCCSGATAANVWVMVQSLWGGGTGAIWVGEAVDTVGCRLVVGAAKQVISKLEYCGLGSMVVR